MNNLTTAARRAVLLGRVSRGERHQDPENQLAPLRAAAARHGWVVVEEIALTQSAWDESSAADVKRRALVPIIEGRADVLAIWSLDRVCRGGIEAAFALLGELIWLFPSIVEFPTVSTTGDFELVATADQTDIRGLVTA